MADAVHWGLDPADVPGDIAVWAERFPLAERLLTDAARIDEERSEPFLLFQAAVSRSDMLRRLGRLGPGDDEYDAARRVWNGAIDRRPALIARPRGNERRRCGSAFCA